MRRKKQYTVETTEYGVEKTPRFTASKVVIWLISMVATLIFYFIAFQLVTVLILEVTQSIVISAGDGKYEDPVLLVVFATSASTATFFYLLTVLKLHKRLRQLLTDVYNKLQRKIQNRKQNKVKDVS